MRRVPSRQFGIWKTAVTAALPSLINVFSLAVSWLSVVVIAVMKSTNLGMPLTPPSGHFDGQAGGGNLRTTRCSGQGNMAQTRVDESSRSVIKMNEKGCPARNHRRFRLRSLPSRANLGGAVAFSKSGKGRVGRSGLCGMGARFTETKRGINNACRNFHNDCNNH